MNKLTQSLILLASFVFSSQALADYHLITNNSVDNGTLTSSEVKSIFLGRKMMWHNGEHILPCYIASEDKTIQMFFSDVIKKSHVRFIRYWNKRLFSGRGSPPVIVASVDDAIDYVEKYKGGICLIIDGPQQLSDGVKIITIKD